MFLGLFLRSLSSGAGHIVLLVRPLPLGSGVIAMRKGTGSATVSKWYLHEYQEEDNCIVMR